MALSQRLEVRQSQALVMTPQLMQAIKLLQLSNLDLVAYVEAEIERNPLLDRSAEEEGAPALAEGAALAAGPNADAEGWGGANASPPSAAPEEPLDTRVEDSFPDHAEASPPRGAAEGPAGYSEWAGVGAGGRDDGDYNLEAFVPAETTLADWLRDQLTLAVTGASRRMIGQYLIDLVDEAGYLSVELEATAERLGTNAGEIEAVLGILQGFDPPGICARDLAECLTLQLKERDRFDPAMQALIARLDLLARRDFAALKKICGVGDEDIADMIAEIRNLNPKPGLAFGSAIVQPIVPDVFVRSGPDGGWIVELNTDTLPKVLVNQTYYAEVSATAKSDTDKSYLADRLQRATWLVCALDQRARSILYVCNDIFINHFCFFS
ncbi:MAG: RNA polymerase factor sigma-54, partial [Stellaceae bacterium]